MIITKTKYSPSVNIIRDYKTQLNYLPTPNTKIVFNQISDDYESGIHCFSLIGAYGSGKSFFLWAFEKSLQPQHKIFKDTNNNLKAYKEIEVIRIVGSYDSFISIFSQTIGFKFTSESKPKEIIDRLDMIYMSASKNHKGLLILIDELGKFLEYAAKNNSEEELYFIQQLTEYINDNTKNIILLSTLHQDFRSYALGLSKFQINEWDKVKGRLKDISFNEPVEQLLYLVSEKISTLNASVNDDKNFLSLFNAIKESKSFPLRDYFDINIAKKLLPFDILSASILTLALQKYGQNERSVFSFLELNEPFGLKEFFKNKNQYYSLSSVYDYLMYNYESFLYSKFNPHFSQWSAIKSSIERVENLFDENVEDAIKIIKSIGLLNIFISAAGKIDKEFLDVYGKVALKIANPIVIVKKLESQKIIRYSKHKEKYALFEGSDLDIDLAINQAGELIGHVADAVSYLDKYLELDYIPAKSFFYTFGTPRVFQFKLSEIPINIVPEGEIDGFVNLIFSEKLKAEDIKKHSKEADEPILFGLYSNMQELLFHVFEIEKIKNVIENNQEDKIAIRELISIQNHHKNLLKHYLINSLYTKNSPVQWFYNGKKLQFENVKVFNKQLSIICDEVYSKTPRYHNELINKTKISGQISNAKRVLLQNLITHFDKKDLGFSENKFPPEKTIYLSLLKNTGIHTAIDDNYFFDEPSDNSFKELWNASGKFINSAKNSKRSLNDLISMLLQKPFKLKRGFIDFWIPIFLFIKREEYALFNDNIFIPDLNEEVFELINKAPHKFYVKAFDINGIKLEVFNKYRELLNKSYEGKISKSGFVDTIKPFLAFYKNLNEYSKNTKKLSKEAINIRRVIANSKDLEKVFFEDFPEALKYNINVLKSDKKSLENYIKELQDIIKEIRISHDGLILRVEKFIGQYLFGNDLTFGELKLKINKRYNLMKENLLNTPQKIFYSRLITDMEDSKSWINAIAQSLLKKPLETINDNDEDILFEKLKDAFQELDNMFEITNLHTDLNDEEIIKFDITSLNNSISKNILRYPKSKEKEITKLQNNINRILTDNSIINKAALIKILKEQI